MSTRNGSGVQGGTNGKARPPAEQPVERCVIYCRVSDAGQSSIGDQERWGRTLAEQHAWTVAAVVVDEGLSGDDQTRPGLARLDAVFSQNQIAGCPVTRLLVQKTDRLSRSDTLDAFEVLARLRRLGLRHVVTTQRDIDLQSRLDRTLYALEQDHSNNPFLATMAERALNGMVAVAQAGFWLGTTPAGYRLERRPGEHGVGKRRRSGRLVPDPETAPVIRELFERYATGGESTTSLGAWLTARVRPPRAPRWSAVAVRAVLMNEVYVGVRRFGRRSQGKHVRLGDGGAVAQQHGLGAENIDAALVIRDASLAIVPEDLFRRVQDRLAAGRGRGYRKGTHPLPLSGLGRCGTCGGRLHVSRQGKYRRLVCINHVRYGVETCPDGSAGAAHDDVLAAVIDTLAETLLSGNAAEKLTRLAERRVAEAEAQAEACRAALLRRAADLDASLVRSQRRLVEVDGDMVADVQAGVRQLRQERADVQKELDRLGHEQSAAAEVSPERFRAFWEACKQAVDLFRQADYPPSLQPLLAELIQSVTVFWKRDVRGRTTPGKVDVELPPWLTALVSKARPAYNDKCPTIVLSREL